MRNCGAKTCIKCENAKNDVIRDLCTAPLAVVLTPNEGTLLLCLYCVSVYVVSVDVLTRVVDGHKTAFRSISVKPYSLTPQKLKHSVYKWLILDKRVNFMDLSSSYGKYIIQPKRSKIALPWTLLLHARRRFIGALVPYMHLRTLRSGPDQAHRLPGAPVPATKDRIRNSAGRLPRCSRHSLLEIDLKSPT